MSFISRAQKWRARGENARALLVLVEGIKRAPDSEEGIDLLLRWYALEIPTQNLQTEVVECLALQHDGDDLLSTVVDNLRGAGHLQIAEDVLVAGKLVNLNYIPADPAALVTAPPDSKPPADQTFEATIAVSQAPEVESVPPSVTEPPLVAQNVPEPPSVAQNKAAKVDTPKKSGVTTKPARRLNKRWAIAVAALLLLIAVVYLSRDKARKMAAEASIDAELTTLDPLNLVEVLEEAQAANAAWPEDRAFAERLAFVEILTGTRRTETHAGPAETPYGMAATALSALEAGEFEAAISTASRLEHTFPDEPIALWVQGVVLERRGKLSAAGRIFESLTSLHGDFLAGWLGKIRVQTRLGDLVAAKAASDNVAKLVSNHPYLIARTVNFPELDDFTGARRPPSKPMISAEPNSPDLFTASVAHLQNSLAALRSGDLHQARVDAEIASKDSQLVSAQLLVSVLRLADYDVERAEAALQNIAHLDGVSEQQLLLVQSVAPLAFSYAGRPDVARRYIAMFGVDVDGVDGQQEGAFKTRWNEWRPAMLPAVLARLAVMNELGMVDSAVKLAQQFLGQPGGEPLGYVIVLLAEQGGATVQSPPLEGEASLASEVTRAAVEGRSRKVIELAGRIPSESRYRSLVVRFLTQAHLALRETGDALGVLDRTNAPVVEMIFLDGMRLRVLSRFGKGNAQFTEASERLMKAEPVGVNRLTDLAYAMFWQGRAKESEAHILRALELNPGHRQANWLYGLLLRERGNFREAQQYFDRSGRDYDNSVDVLIELGIALGELGNHEESRKMFYKALLLDRSSLDALAGLGSAYVKVDPETAVRDLERIVSGYPATRELGAQRAEALKWLAVVKGVRKGNEEALSYLDTAESLVGKRPDLVIERARYSEAVNDFAGARALYAQALQRNSALGEAHLGLAKMAIREGDTKVARDHLEKYLELEPQGESRPWAEKKLASF